MFQTFELLLVHAQIFADDYFIIWTKTIFFKILNNDLVHKLKIFSRCQKLSLIKYELSVISLLIQVITSSLLMQLAIQNLASSE